MKIPAVPPCFMVSHTLWNTIIFLTTNVSPHVVEYSAVAFDYALHSPFNELLSVRFSATQTLCTAHFSLLSLHQWFFYI